MFNDEQKTSIITKQVSIFPLTVVQEDINAINVGLGTKFVLV